MPFWVEMSETDKEAWRANLHAVSLRQLWKICSSFGLRRPTWSANILVSSHKPQLHMCTCTYVCVCQKQVLLQPGVTSSVEQMGLSVGLFSFTPSSLSPLFPVQSLASPPSWPAVLGEAVFPCYLPLAFISTLLSSLYYIPFLSHDHSLSDLFFCSSCLKTWYVAASVFLPRATRMINER